MFAQDNLDLERTGSNTPTYLRSQELRRSKHASGNREEQLQTWNSDPIPSESRDWLDEGLQGQAVHAENWQKHHFIAKEFIRKIYKLYQEETISR